MSSTSEQAANLGDLADRFDAFLLDAFGVLNIGNSAIAGAPERVKLLQDLGKRVLVLTNGATFPAEQSLQKFFDLGFEFSLTDIVSSREALNKALKIRYQTGFWGAMAAAGSQLETLGVRCQKLGIERSVYDAASGFLLLSTAEWTDDQQSHLLDSLKENPRPVLVGNPDIVAPREQGLTLEPGFFAYELNRQLNIRPHFFGKPYGNVYDLALSNLPDVDLSRVLMVGDTLHTDILGGAAYGFRTALVTDHGLFSGRKVAPYIQQTGIVPDYVVPTI
ncbi:HAD-IIA family hydrolase [Alisedimentitalea sp. MJ-SS2]|uniref:HAD-IIA family hydrolase n=1 Tax=Aliisedimentitalea sp. MJ-SS2 TaxID=3049795 RepID=UPI00290FE1CA|nr:HAD-IIA family hydrolase [Alisedimentitalea sp. MJ-SS2]MDU8926768.1 HAD-IIA family hydrolase [Alisedimentitalea sp. MJ-SS2]